MKTTKTLKDYAEVKAAEHGAAYRAEFGEHITRETAGDWDAVSLGEAWREYAIDTGRDSGEPDYLDAYQEFRVAYLSVLLDEEIS